MWLLIMSVGSSRKICNATNVQAPNCCRIENKDYRAEFNGKNWIAGGSCIFLKSRNLQEFFKVEEKAEFEKEVEWLIVESILSTLEGEVKEEVLPLMAVIQVT